MEEVESLQNMFSDGNVARYVVEEGLARLKSSVSASDEMAAKSAESGKS